MLNKYFTVLLLYTILLFFLSPSKVFAQTQVEVGAVKSEQKSSVAQTNPKPDLKAYFAQEMAKTKSGTPVEVDFKRLEKEQLNSKPNAKLSEKRKTVILLVVIGVAITALVVVLASQPYKGPKECDGTVGNPLCPLP